MVQAKEKGDHHELVRSFHTRYNSRFNRILPISSTGHLYLGRHLFRLDEAGLFFRYDAAYWDFTCGFIYYKKEFIYLIKNPFSKLMLLLIVGTIPAVVIGLLFKDFFEDISKQESRSVGSFSDRFFLYMADKQKNGRKNG